MKMVANQIVQHHYVLLSILVLWQNHKSFNVFGNLDQGIYILISDSSSSVMVIIKKALLVDKSCSLFWDKNDGNQCRVDILNKIIF